MARTVKMQWLPGTRMAPPGARAQGAVARDILGRLRARARVSRSKFRKIRAPQCQTAVKMGGRTVQAPKCIEEKSNTNRKGWRDTPVKPLLEVHTMSTV